MAENAIPWLYRRAHYVANPFRKFWDRCFGWYELRMLVAKVVYGRRLTALALDELHNA
jgi:hypothetical protein